MRFILALILLYGLLGCSQPNTPTSTHIHGDTMGTHWSVKVVDRPERMSSTDLSKGVQQTLEQIEQLMSTWRPDSELSRFNLAPIGKWFQLSAETIEVLELALKVAKETKGSFDITVAPLVNLWGFGPRDFNAGNFNDLIPDNAAIKLAKSKVGYEQISIDKNSQQAIKKAERIIDLSAIAKGYAVDKVAAYLDSLGAEHYLVEVGGEIRAKGHKTDGSHWRIAIESPLVDQRRAHQALELIDAAVATSGDYRNYFEKNGIRYSHTIDPTSGRPITHALASVTVIAETAAIADAYATALMVMGTDKGIQFAERKGIAAYFILKKEESFRERYTSQFDIFARIAQTSSKTNKKIEVAK